MDQQQHTITVLAFMINFIFKRDTCQYNPHVNQLPLLNCQRLILSVWRRTCGGYKLKLVSANNHPAQPLSFLFSPHKWKQQKRRLNLHSELPHSLRVWNDKLAPSTLMHLPQIPLSPIQYSYFITNTTCVPVVYTFSTQTAVVYNKLCIWLCVRAISQPPAGLGAGCYLAGQLGFGGAVWVSGRTEKGPSISGVDLLLEKQGHFRLHSAWDSQHDWKKGLWGSGGHRSLSCSLRPLGGSTAKHP